MNIDSSGRRALVSGSSQGIGLAIATELARAGASVVVNGRSADTTQQAGGSIVDQLPDADVMGGSASIRDRIA